MTDSRLTRFNKLVGNVKKNGQPKEVDRMKMFMALFAADYFVYPNQAAKERHLLELQADNYSHSSPDDVLYTNFLDKLKENMGEEEYEKFIEKYKKDQAKRQATGSKQKQNNLAVQQMRELEEKVKRQISS